MKRFLIYLSIFMLTMSISSCIPQQKLHKQHKKHSVILLQGTIKEVKHRSNDHQYLIINNIDVLIGKLDQTPNEIFLAIRYGDRKGLSKPIPHLRSGEKIEAKGEYIPADEAYKTIDNPGDPVLHFTHHPVGYVLFEGNKYQ